MEAEGPLAADIIYVFMKPMEWLFLGVIYLCDAHPEDRIALQYMDLPEGFAEAFFGKGGL